MQDVAFVIVLVAFFGLAALFVAGCHKIIGPDDAALAEGGRDQVDGNAQLEREVA